LRLCDEAISQLPNNVDYYYFRALINNQTGNYKNAMDDLKKGEKIFTDSAKVPETRVLMPNPLLLYYQLSIAAKGLNGEQDELKYTTVVNSLLSEGKEQPKVLGPYLVILFRQGKTGTEVFEKLAPVYNTGNKQDMLLIARAAKEYGIITFAQMIMEIVG